MNIIRESYRPLREGHIGDSDTAFKAAEKILRALHENGNEAYFVGGCVRDAKMGKDPKDYDIICSRSGGEKDIIDLFPGSESLSNPPEGRIIKVVMDGEEFETMICRMEIEKNLEMRDLTINAMAYDPISNKTLDPTGGEADIKAKKLKFTHFMLEKVSSGKAPLAMLRIFRFKARYTDYDIDKTSLDAVDNFVAAGGTKEFKKVKVDRINTEIHKIEEGYGADEIFEVFKDIGIYDELMARAG